MDFAGSTAQGGCWAGGGSGWDDGPGEVEVVPHPHVVVPYASEENVPFGARAATFGSFPGTQAGGAALDEAPVAQAPEAAECQVDPPSPEPKWLQELGSGNPKRRRPALDPLHAPPQSIRAAVAARQAGRVERLHHRLAASGAAFGLPEASVGVGDEGLVEAAEKSLEAAEAAFMKALAKQRQDERNPNRLPDKLKEVLKAQRAALVLQSKTEEEEQEHLVWLPPSGAWVRLLNPCAVCAGGANSRAAPAAAVRRWERGLRQRPEEWHLRGQGSQGRVRAEELPGDVVILCAFPWMEEDP
jgi:hypothetical protein